MKPQPNVRGKSSRMQKVVAGLILLGFPLSVTSGVLKYRAAQRWDETTCTIASYEARQGRRGYVFDLTYRYSVGGKGYESKQYDLFYDQPYIYSVEDIKYMVAEAAAAGLKLAAHCVTEQGARNAAEAGVASIEHGFEMSNEALELAKKNNVVLVGTDFTEKAWLAYDLPAEVAKRLHERSVDRLRRAYKIGVTLAFGSDLIFYAPDETRGTWTMSQIETFVEAGIPARSILQAMTTNAARLLGVEKARGAISPGQFADIIAAPENPLDNISALKQVMFVMKNGKVFKQAR